MPIDDAAYDIPSIDDLAICSISHRDAYIARELAQSQAKETGGIIATLPELLTWRMESDDEELHHGWCLLDSDEYIVHSPGGDQIMLVVHGGGIFSDPDMVHRLERSFWDRGVEIDLADSYYLQAGIHHTLPSFPVFSYDSFIQKKNLPRRYGVRMELDRIAGMANGYLPLHRFDDHPLFIARCGGKETASAYLDYLARRGEAILHAEFFDYETSSPRGFIIHSICDAHVTPFFGGFSTMTDPHYLVAHKKRFHEHRGGYRDAAKRQ